MINGKANAALLAALALLAAGSSSCPAGGEKTAQAARPAKRRASEPFVIADQDKFIGLRRAAGDILCDIMYMKREQVLANLKADKGNRKVTILQCMGPQREMLAMFLPFADRVLIFPFHLLCSKKPEPGDLIWPAFDNPVVNRLREIRQSAPTQYLYASLHCLPSGTSRAFWGGGKRDWTYQEQEWRFYASIGADFDGILWCGARCREWTPGLDALEEALKPQAVELGAAEPVDWVLAPQGQPCGALASKKRLFVVFLHPEYMRISATGQEMALPLSPSRRSGEIRMRPPEGVTVCSGNNLQGMPARVVLKDGAMTAAFSFAGGGEMLVFELRQGVRVAKAGAAAGGERE
jgi:hypothetical protein